jgi:molybdopterin biosynthesis enzyme
MTDKEWNPRMQRWRLKRLSLKDEPESLRQSIAPLMCAPVMRTELVPVANSKGRVLVSDVSAKSQMPLWDIAEVQGSVFNSADTNLASHEAPIQLKGLGHYKLTAPPESGGGGDVTGARRTRRH